MNSKDSRKQRAEAIAEEMRENRLTLEQMGARMGVTRERVRQILAEFGIETPKTWTQWGTPTLGTCPTCGGQYLEPRSWNEFYRQKQLEQAAELGVEIGIFRHTRKVGHPFPWRAAQVSRSESIAADYEAGMELADICTKYNINRREEIYRHLDRFGVERRYPNRLNRPIGRDAMIQRGIAELYKTTKAKDIAKAEGVSESRIYQIAEKYGVRKS